MPTLLPQGTENPLVFVPDAAHVAGILASVLTGWPLLAGTGIPQKSPLASISIEGDKTLIEYPDGGIVREPSAVSAVCSLVVEIVDAFAAASPGMVCLHAAAAEFAGRLVLFPATHHAGKSTLMARLAAGERRVFADDILPFDLATGEAVATGCLPRLRLPLPRAASSSFVSHVAANTVASDGYYAYLASQPGSEVAFDARLPLGAVVLLDRRKRRVKARLEAVSPDTALLEILMRNTRGDRDAPRLVATFAAIVGGLPVRRLVYSDLEDAVRCLETAFDGGYAEVTAPPAPAPALLPKRSRKRAAGPTYRRNAAIAVSRMGQSGFLADPGDNSIHVLDAVGLGVWNLLEIPQDAASLADIVAGAFPSMPRKQIAADIDTLLATLTEKGLIDRLAA